MTKDDINSILDKFDLYDKDLNGKLDKEEFEVLMNEVTPPALSPDLVRNLTNLVFSSIDLDSSNQISRLEFIKGYGNGGFLFI